MGDSHLTRARREAALQFMADAPELDLLVIGGGVTGVGIALDASSRGLTTGIVEAQDWASGTSSRSSKLVHGGLRYLQMLDFKLVLEALRERDLLLTSIAPHLVRSLPFLYPLRHRILERAVVGAGILLYDLLATARTGKRAVPFHRHLTRKSLTEAFPDLAKSAAIGAIEYWDANVDDARLVLTVLRTAVSYGAHAASRTQVVELTKNAQGAVEGAILVDLETGTAFAVRTKTIVSSTGVWTEQTQSLAGDDGGLRVLASKGIHIVVPKDRIRGTPGLILKTAKSVLFLIPWSRYWVIGTTDTPWTEDLVNPVATERDIGYVLSEANKVLAHPISRADVIGTWAGLRPLLQPGTMSGSLSAKVSREHTVASAVPGLISIAGGKLTTYRIMARDAVDFAIGASARRSPSVTSQIPLEGAQDAATVRRELAEQIRGLAWDASMVNHLFHRYGSNVRDILDIVRADPTMAIALTHAPAYLRGEIVYAITHEGALHLDDLMMRRTRAVYEYINEGIDAVEEVVEIARDHLGWSESDSAREVELYRKRAAAEARAAEQRDDSSAARERGRAIEIVPMVNLAKRGRSSR